MEKKRMNNMKAWPIILNHIRYIRGYQELWGDVKKMLLIGCLCLMVLPVFPHTDEIEGKPEIIIIHQPEVPRAEKEALLILPGLGDGRKGRKHQKKFFQEAPYDLFIPDFHDRKSYEGTLKNFTQFFADQKLGEYKKVHVFSYLLGAWILNTYISEHGVGNIQTIVYDRSPIQERAPQTVRDKIPGIAKLAVGKLVIDLSYVPYPSIPHQDLNIGIIVESKATKLMRIFKKTAISYGPIDWKKLTFDQEYDDLIFTRLNHDEMYYTFEEIGMEILHFIEKGSFPPNARREPFDWDPFEKYKKSLRQ